MFDQLWDWLQELVNGPAVDEVPIELVRRMVNYHADAPWLEGPLTGCKTKRAVIEEALRLLTRVKRQEQVRAHHGKLHWEGDLDALRTDRGGDVAG